jgi:hypothetical protein
VILKSPQINGMNKKIVIICILVLVLLTGSFFWLNQRNNKLEIRVPKETSEIQEKTQDQPDKIEIERLKKGKISESGKPGWNKYRNEYFHFEFEYPKEWYLEDEEPKKNSPNSIKFSILLFTKPFYTENILQIYPEGNWKNKLENLPDLEVTEISINGHPSDHYARDARIYEAVKIKEELPPNWNKDNEIIFQSTADKKLIFDKILNSLHFF